MRANSLIALLCILVPVGALAGGLPSLKALNRFRPGLYQVTPIDNAGRLDPRHAKARCLAAPDTLFSGGEVSVSPTCSFTIVEDRYDRATVAYSCSKAGSGRTGIRQTDPGYYIVDAQGVTENGPFATRNDYRHTGPCR